MKFAEFLEGLCLKKDWWITLIFYNIETFIKYVEFFLKNFRWLCWGQRSAPTKLQDSWKSKM